MSETAVAWEDGYMCSCRNTAADQGFFPCTPNGKDTDPASPAWQALPLWRCCECGEIKNAATGEILVYGWPAD